MKARCSVAAPAKFFPSLFLFVFTYGVWSTGDLKSETAHQWISNQTGRTVYGEFFFFLHHYTVEVCFFFSCVFLYLLGGTKVARFSFFGLLYHLHTPKGLFIDLPGLAICCRFLSFSASYPSCVLARISKVSVHVPPRETRDLTTTFLSSQFPADLSDGSDSHAFLLSLS